VFGDKRTARIGRTGWRAKAHCENISTGIVAGSVRPLHLESHGTTYFEANVRLVSIQHQRVTDSGPHGDYGCGATSKAKGTSRRRQI
jgi:hypothetical protein